MEVQGMVLRSRGIQTRLVVAVDDGVLHCPRYRTHVRVPPPACGKANLYFPGRKRSLRKTLQTMSEVSHVTSFERFADLSRAAQMVSFCS
jgi:hypothetical protein